MVRYISIFLVFWLATQGLRVHGQQPNLPSQGYSGWLVSNGDGNSLLLYIDGVGIFGEEDLSWEFLQLLDQENFIVEDELDDASLIAGYRASAGNMEIPPIPTDPTQPPGPDWRWAPPTAPVGSPGGAWVRNLPGGGTESLHPDLQHLLPKGPHWTWNDQYGNQWDRFPDGSWEPANGRVNYPRRPRPQFPEITPPNPTPFVPVIIPITAPPPVVPVPYTPPPPITPPWWIRLPIPIFIFDLRLVFDDGMA